MSYSWKNCPQLINDQVLNIVSALQSVLCGKLVSIYLHGSLALGCFNPSKSDVDLLVVVRQPLTDADRLKLAQLCLKVSSTPSPLELSVITEQQIDEWVHPSPFEFHFSEELRSYYTEPATSGGLNKLAKTDADLAAHITVVLSNGIALYGKPAAEVFHEVPRADFVAALLGDYNWGKQRLQENPTYFILNACRFHAFLAQGHILSKAEGAAWALDHYSEKYHHVIEHALNNYSGKSETNIGQQDVAAFACFIDSKISTVEKVMPDHAADDDEYERSKGKPYSLSEARKIIELSDPPLSVDSIEFIGHGMASCAYLVNDRYVFRLPKTEQASGTLKREVCLLPKLKSYLNIKIPDIRFLISENTSFGKVCVGYESIIGVPLDRQLWRTMDDEHRKHIVAEVAAFLKDMHSFPVESALSCYFAVENNRQIYKKYEEYFVNEIFQALNLEEQEIIKQLFNEYFADSRNFQYKPALVHGDISPAHILIDPVTSKLSGIIDFGDMAVTDPDRDLIWLYEDFDQDFCEMLLQNDVCNIEPERLRTKLNLFRLCVTTIFIREGIQEQNDVKIKMGWCYLQKNIKELV